MPFADIVYFADRANSPYGTKSKDELVGLVKNDIRLLKDYGASQLLIACCTASTVFYELSESEREGVIPIISPAASVACKYRKILVIATEATVRSHAFSKKISEFNSQCRIDELATQPLVSYVEGGARCGSLPDGCRRMLDSLAEKITVEKYDALVLGCTHFSHLEGEFKARLCGVAVISPAREGALALIAKSKKENNVICRGCGRTVFIKS